MKNNIIIVESGATKSDWRVLNKKDGSEVKRFVRAGTNVSAMRMDAVKATLTEAFTSEGLEGATGFYFYTAGVVTSEVAQELYNHIWAISAIPDIDIQNDMMGAARSVCGRHPGITAILGTGSNTCFYDGTHLTQKVYTGGYILGDEGSGACLGKLFLADFIKGLVPDSVSEDFSKEFDSSYAGIVQNVYRSDSPSGYLGSLAPFLLRHYDDSYVKGLIEKNFQAFIDRALLRYDVDTYPVGIVGGLGWAFQDIIRPLMDKAGIHISRFIKAPIEGLCQYHLNYD